MCFIETDNKGSGITTSSMPLKTGLVLRIILNSSIVFNING